MIKQVIKAPLRLLWKLSAPVRRPVARKLDQKMNHMVAVAIQSRLLPELKGSMDASEQALARLERSMGHANHSAQALATEMDLMVSSLIREVARLQAQVDHMQELVEHAISPGHNGFSVIRHDGEDDSHRSKVG